jgi:predicted protein tyrosine phosphatase
LRPRFRHALAVSAGLSLLFLVVYGGCNWITAQRGDVGMFYFQWERAIPFVPLFIVPYLSIDLFFIGAPFLCQTNEELRIFSRRVIAAIVVAGFCFLLFPLRFAFPRPHAMGWTGALFDWFRGMDAPYNLAPSLHATFWIFLFQIYAEHTRGLLRGVVIAWMALIGLSPMFTYQHHVIDIVTGFALAGYCLYFFAETDRKLPVIANYRIGLYYLVGAFLLFIVVGISWPWGVLLLWPGIALSIVAAAYFGLGPIIFRKTNGRLPWSSWLVLSLCLFGQYLSLLYYRRQCRRWDEITPRVWIGCKLGEWEASAAVNAGVTAVLDVSAEFSEARAFRAVRYKSIPVLDLTAPTFEQLNEMASFIAEQSRYGTIYVHCKIGYSRSAGAVATYLIWSSRAADLKEAVAMIRRVRPSIVIRPEIVSALLKFESQIRSGAAGGASFLLASAPGQP